jgi:hypothetical protein
MPESLKKFLVTTGGILGTLLVAVVAFTNLSPQLGGTPTRQEKEAFAKSGHYQNGKFVNLLPTKELTGGSTASIMWKVPVSQIA